MEAQEILKFWFTELTPDQWFQGGNTVDEIISHRFKKITEQAKAGELAEWLQSLHGRLAEIIVLDQFSRNIYRDDYRAHSSDDMALTLAQEAKRLEDISKLSDEEQLFLYMPFMHAESLKIQEQSVALFKNHKGPTQSVDIAVDHYNIIAQFGRFPHRNKRLDRLSTPEEIAFMKTHPGF